MVPGFFFVCFAMKDDSIPSNSTGSLWTTLAFAFTPLAIAFWVDFAQPDFVSKVPFLSNFRENEVWILALPTAAVFSLGLSLLGWWHYQDRLNEAPSPKKWWDYLPRIPKVDIGGRRGRILQVGYFSVLTLSPIAVMAQSFYDFSRSQVVELQEDGSFVVVAKGLTEMLFPRVDFAESGFGSGIPYRFVDGLGKEAFPLVQPWAYVVVSVATLVGLALYLRCLFPKRPAQVRRSNRSKKQRPKGVSGRYGIAAAVSLFAFPTDAGSKDLAGVGKTAFQLRISEEFAQEQVVAQLPKSILIDDKKELLDLGIWRDIRLEDIAAEVNSDSVRVRFAAPDKVILSGSGMIRSKLLYEYSHDKVEMRMKKVGFVKTKVPVLSREWRTKEGSASAPVDLELVYQVRLAANAKKGRVLELSPVPSESRVSVGDIDISGVNSNMERIGEAAGNYLAGQKAEEVFLLEFSEVQSIAFADKAPFLSRKLADRIRIVIVDGELFVYVPKKG